jgi:hypothetical protein
VTAASVSIGGMENEQAVASWSPGPKGPARIYKNRAKGQTKKESGSCIACFPRNVAGQQVPLAYGVSLVLCKGHRDPTFIATRSGRDFLSAVSTLFTSLGITARRYSEALRRFIDQVANPQRYPAKRHRPESYAWPERRQDAETVWSRGGSFEQGRRAALADPPDARTRARPPSSRTVRRWWQDRRWLRPPA